MTPLGPLTKGEPLEARVGREGMWQSVRYEEMSCGGGIVFVLIPKFGVLGLSWKDVRLPYARNLGRGKSSAPPSTQGSK